MTTSGPVEPFVDTIELDRLRREIQRLIVELDEVPEQPAAAAGAEAMGSTRVAGAVEGFVNGWRDGRARIRENLHGCELLIDLAIASDEAAEAALRSAALGGVGVDGVGAR